VGIEPLWYRSAVSFAGFINVKRNCSVEMKGDDLPTKQRALKCKHSLIDFFIIEH